MTTAEDVFPLYERDLLYYLKYNNNNNDNNDNNQCYLDAIVQPFTIGEKDVICDFKRKCYIKPGEECPICFDKINSKKEAYLTPCGHSFHKSCLSNTFISKWEQKACSNLRCPMCRANLGCNPSLINRYNSDYSLDILENFWITKDFETPIFCSYKVKHGHFLGMNKECKNCKHYIITGMEI